MDQITIFGDIHGNMPALESVLADIEARGLKNVTCLGDLVGYGAAPNEVVATIRERNIPILMGNYDQAVGNNSDDCGCAYKSKAAEALGKQSIAWTNEHTLDEHKVYLRNLPAHIPLELGGLKVLLVHGSPRKVNEYLYADRPDASFERIMDAAEADVLVCGHTHLPYHKILPSGRQIINAGSVGKPIDGGPRAGYVVLNSNNDGLTVDFMRVGYDVEAAATAIEASEMPDEFAQMLRTAAG